MQNAHDSQASGRLKSALRHPFAGFVLIGVLLIGLQLSALLTDGAWPKSSMLNGFASVMIYAIVGYGFTFLLGYAGLASLGTAGFVGLGAYMTAYALKNMPGVPYIVVLLAALLVSLLRVVTRLLAVSAGLLGRGLLSCSRLLHRRGQPTLVRIAATRGKSAGSRSPEPADQMQ